MFKSKFLMLTSVWYALHNCLMMWMRKKLARDLANQAEIILQPSTQTIWPLYPWTIHLLYFYNLEIKYLLATHSHQSQNEAAPAFGSNTEGSRLLEATVWFQCSVDHQRSSPWCPTSPWGLVSIMDNLFTSDSPRNHMDLKATSWPSRTEPRSAWSRDVANYLDQEPKQVASTMLMFRSKGHSFYILAS